MAHEYITKKEYKPKQKEALDLLEKLHDKLKKKENGCKFSQLLIGSARSRLVTRNGDNPFDFDFTLYVTSWKNNNKWEDGSSSEANIRQIFFDNLIDICKENKFEKPYNGSRVIRIDKKSDNETDYRIEIAICKIDNNTSKENISKYNEEKDNYIWNENEDMDSEDLKKRFNEIRKNNKKGIPNEWSLFKDIYLDKKNDNEQEEEELKKKSISLYKETIKEVEDARKQN